MSVDSETAERYRVHAEELRIIAAEAGSVAISRALLKIADDYDRMAASLEAIDRSNAAIHEKLNKP